MILRIRNYEKGDENVKYNTMNQLYGILMSMEPLLLNSIEYLKSVSLFGFATWRKCSSNPH